MNILFISNLYPPNAVGGYERLCADVAAAFVDRGHRVTVLTSSFGAQVSRHPGQVVHQAMRLLVGDSIYDGFDGTDAQRHAINRSNVRAVRQLIEHVQPDVIYCWNLYGLDPSLLDALARSGVPVLLMLTDNWLLAARNPAFVAEFFRTEVLAPHCKDTPSATLETVRQPALPFAAIFGAAYMRDFYRRGGVTFQRDAVIHNGVRQIAPDQARFRDRRSTVREGHLNLLFAGRIVDVKGVHVVIEAMPRIRDLCGPRHKVNLSIIGDVHDKAYFDRLMSAAHASGCADGIAFLPSVAEGALFDLFQNHDVYVFPSLYEPFSLTLILALAAGIPTIASRVGGNVEIVHDNESGLLFDRADTEGLARAVARLAGDPALRERIAAGGRSIAAGFTFAHMIEGMERFIKESVTNGN